MKLKSENGNRDEKAMKLKRQQGEDDSAEINDAVVLSSKNLVTNKICTYIVYSFITLMTVVELPV